MESRTDQINKFRQREREMTTTTDQNIPPKKRSPGRKDDQNKPRWSLVPFGPMKEVVKVLTFGAEKYGAGNWKEVDRPKDRYFSAAVRHLTTWFSEEQNDKETGMNHLAHAACCVLFLLWFDMLPKVRLNKTED